MCVAVPAVFRLPDTRPCVSALLTRRAAPLPTCASLTANHTRRHWPQLSAVPEPIPPQGAAHSQRLVTNGGPLFEREREEKNQESKGLNAGVQGLFAGLVVDGEGPGPCSATCPEVRAWAFRGAVKERVWSCHSGRSAASGVQVPHTVAAPHRPHRQGLSRLCALHLSFCMCEGRHA